MTNEYDRLAVLLEHCLPRQVTGGLDGRAGDAYLRGEPRPLRRRTAGNQIEADVKRPGRVVPRPHVAAAGAGDRLDDRRDGFAFDGVDCHIGLLPDVEMRAIVLIDLRDELDPGLVEDVRNL